MIDPKLFERQEHELSDVVPGVDAVFLADLYDCVSKFGRQDPTGKWRILSFAGEPPLHVSACVVPGVLHMKVLRVKHGIPFSAEQILTMLLSDPFPSCLIWDRTVGVWEAKALVAATDLDMSDRGLYDHSAGPRPRVERDDPPAKYEVDEVFKNRDILFQLEEGADSKAVIAMFDRPDELRAVVTSASTKAICHVKGRQWRRATATDVVFKRWGFTRAEAFNSLSEPEKKRFLAEVATEIQRRDN